MEQNTQTIPNRDVICIKAMEDGVSVIGVTRGRDTRYHHTEKLGRGEVMLCQFTETTAAIKVRGAARILTPYGEMTSDAERGN